MIAATPASSNRRARSSALSSDVSAQPSTATLPFLASRPTAIRFGYFFAASFTSAGSRTAAVPMMTRLTPLPSQPSMVAMSRMPPPSCTQRPTVSRMRSTADTFIGLPAKAPSRSTTCRCLKPCVSKMCACAAGSRLNTVARAMSPSSRRTARPSFRSMAGNRITLGYSNLSTSFWGASAAREPGNQTLALASGFRARPYGSSRNGKRKASRLPFQEIGDQRKPKFLALFRMELRAGHAIARDDGGDRPAIVDLRDQVRAVHRPKLIGVHEIGVQPVRPQRDAVEQLVRGGGGERVPAHVRDFQTCIGWRDLVDLAADPAE